MLLAQVVIAIGYSSAEVTPRANSTELQTKWNCDTIFIGAETIVKDSTKEVIVTWNKAITRYAGILYFMNPVHPDSIQFLFHNFPSKYVGEPTTVNLGKYPKGTSLVFMYTVIDTLVPKQLQNKKLFSGQNRESIDPFVSELRTNQFGYRWAAASQTENDIVTMGFNDTEPFGFISIIFSIKGASIDKNKIPPFQILPVDTIFEDEMSVSFDINPEALMVIMTNGGSYNDTTRVMEKDGVSLHYYYTVDGSDPVTSSTRIDYSAPFAISSTTTVNVYAAIEGDTTWYPSNVVTKTFTKSGSTGFNQNKLSRGAQNYHFNNRQSTTSKSFDLFGRRITNSKLQHGLHLYTLNGNVYKKVIVE